jgi:S-adenosylmethionine hydrolase
VTNRPIAFITDLGVKDDAVGMCKGMMLAINPQAAVVDITHEVRPFDVHEAGHYLGDLPDYFPDGTVFCCIVYPETGSGPAIAAVNHRGQIFVGPDNGVFSRVLRRYGLREAYEITNPQVCRPEMSRSFLGRDVIASCAAHLSTGHPVHEVGPARQDLVWLSAETESVTVGAGTVSCRVSLVDKNFGNVWTDISRDDLARAGLAHATTLRVRVGDETDDWPLVATFGNVPDGGRLAYFNSRNRLAFALNKRDLAEEIKINRGASVEITPCDRGA